MTMTNDHDHDPEVPDINSLAGRKSFYPEAWKVLGYIGKKLTIGKIHNLKKKKYSLKGTPIAHTIHMVPCTNTFIQH